MVGTGLILYLTCTYGIDVVHAAEHPLTPESDNQEEETSDDDSDDNLAVTAEDNELMGCTNHTFNPLTMFSNLPEFLRDEQLFYKFNPPMGEFLNNNNNWYFYTFNG